MCNKLFESLQVLSIELHIIVSSPFDPEWLHGALTTFIQSQTMREVNDLVLCAVDNKYWRRYLRNLIDAVEKEKIVSMNSLVLKMYSLEKLRCSTTI